MQKVTQKQIDDWKAKYGTIYKITSEDGKVGYIFDPLSDLRIMKLAFIAMTKSVINYVQTVLTNCWLAGDEEIKTDESIGNGLVDIIDEFTELPHCEVTRDGNKFVMTVEGLSCNVRMAKRADIIKAEQKNAAREPFETAVHLLNAIALDLNELEAIRKNTRAYIGLLSGIEKVKDKAYAGVEKL